MHCNTSPKFSNNILKLRPKRYILDPTKLHYIIMLLDIKSTVSGINLVTYRRPNSRLS